MLSLWACSGKKQTGRENISRADTASVPDTGYTGIKKYYSNKILVKEVTFKNGVRDGEMKTYYKGGQLSQRFWYVNGLREDSAVEYFPGGQVFRTTPFKHDTADGIQKLYYSTGPLKAEIKFSKGKRYPALREYTDKGQVISGYPEIIYNITDNYNKTGKVTISLGLSDKSSRSKFYRGDFSNGLCDTTKFEAIKTVDGNAILELKKSGKSASGNVNIIAETITGLGNKYITSKRIELPYKDLK